MTSTPFNVGLGDGSRLSSRVLRPPGGGHTDIFGGEAEPPRGRRAGPPAAPSQIGQGDEPAKPTNGAVTPNQNGKASEAKEAPAPEPAQASAPAPSPQTPPESVKTPPESVKTLPESVKTPTESVSPKAVTPTEPKCEPAKRVRVPPGGFSSGLW